MVRPKAEPKNFWAGWIWATVLILKIGANGEERIRDNNAYFTIPAVAERGTRLVW